MPAICIPVKPVTNLALPFSLKCIKNDHFSLRPQRKVVSHYACYLHDQSGVAFLAKRHQEGPFLPATTTQGSIAAAVQEGLLTFPSATASCATQLWFATDSEEKHISFLPFHLLSTPALLLHLHSKLLIRLLFHPLHLVAQFPTYLPIRITQGVRACYLCSCTRHE